MQLHHLGLATNNAAATAEQYSVLLDAKECHVECFEGMELRFLELTEGTYLELLEPIDADVIETFLTDHGPGFHHVAFETHDIETRLAGARDRGIRLLDKTPRQGAWGHEVAFLHPSDTGGLLIEFVAE